MRARHTWLGAGLAAVPIGAAAQPSPAPEPAPEPIRVELVAPAECGREPDLFPMVVARTRRARPAQGAEPARRFRAVVSREADAVVGTLLAESLDGTTSTRLVRGGACDEVLSALALVVAVAVDPRALAASVPSTPPSPGAAPAAPSAGPTAPRALERPAGERIAPAADGRAASGSFEIGAAFLVLRGAGPSALFGAEATAGRSFGRPGWWAPLVQLGAAYARAPREQLDRGTASFEWVATTLHACPSRIPFAEAVELAVCARAELGVVRGTGDGIAHPQSASGVWGSVGAGAIVRIPLGAAWSARAGAGAGAALARHEFVFDEPRSPVWRVPAWVADGWLGLGYSVF
jgi:hypothetical protein